MKPKTETVKLEAIKLAWRTLGYFYFSSWTSCTWA